MFSVVAYIHLKINACTHNVQTHNAAQARGKAQLRTLMQLPGQWVKGAGVEDSDEVFQNS